MILGLDVSTSVTGVCLLEDDKIVLLDRIEYKKCKTIWEKADLTKDYLDKLKSNNITLVALEEPLMGFRPGMSSAQTISALLRFNGIVSYLARSSFLKEPQYINSAHARKTCGIKLQKTKIGGPQKEQVFKFMSENDLKDIIWPLKKNGVDSVDWSRDATDAYVIAKAAFLLKL